MSIVEWIKRQFNALHTNNCSALKECGICAIDVQAAIQAELAKLPRVGERWEIK